MSQLELFFRLEKRAAKREAIDFKKWKRAMMFFARMRKEQEFSKVLPETTVFGA